jgi:phospholipid transport system substrate-binding protein
MKPLTLRSTFPRSSFLRLFLLTVPLSVGMVTSAGAQTPAAPAAAPNAPAAAAKPKAAKPSTKGKGMSGAGGAAGTAEAEGSKAGAKAAKSDPVPDKDTPATTPPASASPMAELKKSNDQLDKLLKKKYPNWSPEAEAQKSDVRKLVGGFLDYRELAHRSLVKHWDTLTPAQRTDFVTTLRDLVERSYLKQVTGDPNYNIKYQKEEKTGSEAKVEATLNTQARGKKVAIALEYHLIYKDHWFVYDVITDEQSMLENYRAEFNKIINKEGFDALLKRMKKKLDEKDG